MEHKTSEAFITDVQQDQGIIKAIFSVMGNIDLGNDRIHNGAFGKTFAERGHKVLVLDQHRTDSINRAIGKTLHLRELDRGELPMELLSRFPEATGGAEITAQFSLEDSDSKKAFFRLRNKWVNEWSFGYDAFDTSFTREEQNGKTKSIREIRTIKLYEVSPVLFGMNDATMTTGAKSLADKQERVKNAFEFWQKGDYKFDRLDGHDLIATKDGTEFTVLYNDRGDSIEFELLEGGEMDTDNGKLDLEKEENVEETEQKESVQEEQNQETDSQEEKAGRRVSKRDEENLRSVISGLQSAIDSISGMFPAEDEPEGESMELDDSLNTMTIGKESDNQIVLKFDNDFDIATFTKMFEKFMNDKTETEHETETDEAGPIDESLDSEEESPTENEVKESPFDFDKELEELGKLKLEVTDNE